MSIREHIQKADLGSKVTLFELDLSNFGEGVLRFTNGTSGSSSIRFNGQDYLPWAIDASGFEATGDGPIPRPRIAVSNLNGLFTALLYQNNDLEGAVLTRIRTYERFLDDGEEPDPNAIKPKDVYTLSQKIRDDGEQIEWRLVSNIDQEGVQLPARKVIQGYCDHTTRSFDPQTGQFIYEGVTCPYVGVPRDENGVEVASGSDEAFSKRLGTCCQARFGTNAPLPTRAMPGVARLRRR